MTDIKVSDIELSKDITKVSVGGIEAVATQSPIAVEGYKKEFSIVGDALFTTTDMEDVPDWLSTLLNRVVGTHIDDSLLGLQHLDAALQSAINEIATARNTYEEQINIQQTVENSIVSYLSTLNASIEDNTANIVDIKNSYASKDYALSLITNRIDASLNGGAIQAKLTEIRNAITTLRQALSQSIDVLEANLTDTEDSTGATADALDKLYTYTGVDRQGSPTGTGLLADLQIVQKQQDGAIQVFTGTHDVTTYQDVNPTDGVPDPDSIALVVTAEPYYNWTPLEGSGAPTSTDEEIHRVYKDITNSRFYTFTSNGWLEVTESAYLQGLEALRILHIGDTYIKYEVVAGERRYLGSYKFIRTIEDTTALYGTDTEGFTWAKITDTDSQNALVTALQARDLANSKQKVFTVQPSGEQNTGDLWVDVDSDNTRVVRVFIGDPRSQGFLASEWVIADEQLNRFVSTVYTPESNTLKNQIDGKIEYIFVRTTDAGTYSLGDSIAQTLVGPYDHNNPHPVGVAYFQNVPSTTTLLERIAEVVGVADSTREAFHGSVVCFADEDPTEAYWYSSVLGAWRVIRDTSIYDALVTAENAQTSIDGAVVAFYGYESDVNPDNFTGSNEFPVLQYWYDTTTSTLKVRENSSWVEYVSVKPDDTLTAVVVDRVTTDVTGEPVTTPYFTKIDTKIYTYSGNSWVSATLEGLVSESRKLLALDAFLKGPDGQYGSADSKLDVYTKVEVNDAYLKASSKFAYDSDIELPITDPDTGQTITRQLRSGFGIKASMDDQGEVTSEFWVNAQAFRFISTGVPETLDEVLAAGTASSLDNEVQINGGGIVLNDGGAVKSRYTNFGSKDGVFLGYDSDKYQFLAGNGSDYIHYNGNDLSIRTKDIDIRNNTDTFTLNSNATGIDPNIKGAVLEASVLKEVPRIGIPNEAGTGLAVRDLIDARVLQSQHPGGIDEDDYFVHRYLDQDMVGMSIITIQGDVRVKGSCTYQIAVETKDAQANVVRTQHPIGTLIVHESDSSGTYPFTTAFMLVSHYESHHSPVGLHLDTVKPSGPNMEVEIRLKRLSGSGTTFLGETLIITQRRV